MSNISNALINSNGSFYNPLNLKKDDKGNITGLAFDLNNDGKVEDNEIVADSNKDGQLTPNEILNFVVNNVQQIPQIDYVQKVLTDNKTTLAGETLFTKYIDLLEMKKTSILNDAFSAEMTKKQEEINITLVAFKNALANYSDTAELLAKKLLQLLEVTPENPYIETKELINIDRINRTQSNGTSVFELIFKKPVNRKIQGKNIDIERIYYDPKMKTIAFSLNTPTLLEAIDNNSYSFYDYVLFNEDNKVISGHFEATTITIQGKKITIAPPGAELLNGTIHKIRLANSPEQLKAADGNVYTFDKSTRAVSGYVEFNENGLVTNGTFSKSTTTIIQNKKVAVSSGHIINGFILVTALSSPTELKAFDGASYTFKGTIFLDKNNLVRQGSFAQPTDIPLQGKLISIISINETYLGNIRYPDMLIVTLTKPTKLKATDGNTYTFQGTIELNENELVIKK